MTPAARPGGRDRPTIVHVLPRDADRGAQHHGRMLRDLLTSGDQEHLIVTLFGAANDHVAADICLDAPEGAHLRAEARLARVLGRHRPLITVAHGSEPLRYLAVLPRGLRGTLVYHRIGVGMPQLRRQPHRRLHQWLLGRVDGVVAISEDVAAEVRSLAPSVADRTAVIPNGRDPGTYHPPDGRTPGARPPTAIFVGALTHEKRPGLFVEACRRRGAEVTGIVVGDGPLRAELERAVQGTNVTLLGPRRDVPDLLRSSDIFCFTSLPHQEGMPGVLIEAAMSGVPTVATDVAGAREVVLDGATGFVVPHDDEARFCHAFATLVTDAGLRDEMASAAADHGREFSLQRCAERWRSYLQGALASTGAPRAG